MKLIHLNEAQQRAVEYRGGPLLVLAGAGSGKTSVLTQRLSHLVAHHDVPPQRILAVTFTNRAAGEMRRRVAGLLGAEPAGLWIGTFHSLAARMLRREARRLGFTSGFTIYDEDDRLALIKRLLEQAGYTQRAFPPRQIQSVISTAKNRMIPPDELAGSADDRFTRVAAEIYHGLSTALVRANAMDFDDLLLHPLNLFREHPDRLDAYQRRFDSILVDEFQDTNRAQYLLVRQLAAKHRDICVVGDDDQSIYSWRGANVRNMLDFESDFPDAQIVRLEENYRSTQVILDAANAVIAENRQRLGKTLFTSRPGGEPVALVTSADERDEAEWLAREFRDRSASEGVHYQEIAVLYRTNAQSRAFEEAFRRSAIPYRVVGSVGFYERREVKDLLAYLRLVVNPADDEAFLRAVQVPKRGIGIATLRTLQDSATQWRKPLLATAAIADRIVDLRPYARHQLQDFATLFDRWAPKRDQTTPAGLLEQIIEAIDYEAYLAGDGPEGMERLENVRELVAAAAEWSEEVDDGEAPSALEQFLATSALVQVGDVPVGEGSGVTLMTVHTAKGLEWPIVALAGMEEGLFPLSRALETPEGAEEERRLAYVALTRARDRVYVTWARARRRGGQLLPGAPSRFLDVLPSHVVEDRRTTGVFGGEYRRPRSQPFGSSFGWMVDEDVSMPDSQDAPRYVKGERVRHRTFGSGTIRALGGHGPSLKGVGDFDDDEIGTKQLLVAYAGLERDWESA
jgi:DNA helicase-2/ATP-dependent DNA helicase PcrA